MNVIRQRHGLPRHLLLRNTAVGGPQNPSSSRRIYLTVTSGYATSFRNPLLIGYVYSKLAMKLNKLFLSALGFVALASAQRQVLVTYPNDTPPSVIEQAKSAILASVSDDCHLVPTLADPGFEGWENYRGIQSHQELRCYRSH